MRRFSLPQRMLLLFLAGVAVGILAGSLQGINFWSIEMNLTTDEIKKLEETQGEEDRNKVCDEIKAARGKQYPPDWFAVVVLGGLMARVKASWQ